MLDIIASLIEKVEKLTKEEIENIVVEKTSILRQHLPQETHESLKTNARKIIQILIFRQKMLRSWIDEIRNNPPE